MSFSRITTILLSGATVVWGLVSVQAANPVLVVASPSVAVSLVPTAVATTVPSPQPSPEYRRGSASPIAKASPVAVVATVKPVVSLVTSTARPVTTSTPTLAPVATAQPTATPTPVPTPTAAPKSVVGYEIESSSSVRTSGEIEVTGPISVGELTKQIAGKQNINFLYDITDQGWFVTELAGVKNNPRGGFYWFYYVNGVLGNTSVDQYMLKPGDKLRWLYDHTL